jgi:putative FmdB family regulatory protein
MPLYEYKCGACQHRFEVIQKMSDPLVEKCPKCGGTVRKLMSSPAIQFKGSGFYITDYAKKDHVAAEKADKAEGGKAEGGKAETSEKTEKSEKPEKAEKADKAGTSTKAEKSGSGSETSSSGQSGTAGSAPAKDATKGT